MILWVHVFVDGLIVWSVSCSQVGDECALPAIVVARFFAVRIWVVVWLLFTHAFDSTSYRVYTTVCCVNDVRAHHLRGG